MQFNSFLSGYLKVNQVVSGVLLNWSPLVQQGKEAASESVWSHPSEETANKLQYVMPMPKRIYSLFNQFRNVSIPLLYRRPHLGVSHW